MEILWHREEEEKMQVNQTGEVVYLTFPSLDKEKNLLHGFSTRLGGVSEGEFSSMNLSTSRGDSPENVRENYRRITVALGTEPERLVTTSQTHTTKVRRVYDEDKGEGVVRPCLHRDVDGLITDYPGVVLTTFYADCVPLYFYDPVHKAVGLSHSGWRGTVARMGAVTVHRMQEEFGTVPADLLCAIGPSICKDCYEVSEDVILAFREAFSPEGWTSLFEKKKNGKYQLDLWEANRRILLEAGVREERITLPNLCTCCNPELLFSHRASKGKRGNLAAFLGLRE